jgi:hypothetical protein
MSKSIGVAVFFAALFVAGAVAAQGMLLDYAAEKVITKYQSATCEQLKVLKDEPLDEKRRWR